MKDGEAHLWLIDLDRGAAEIGELRQTMTPDEIDRAGRFHFEIHRTRFIAGRGRMRHLLSGYAGIPPKALRFEYAEFGKPSLAAASGGEGLRFNFSNSRNLALLAITARGEIGADIEYADPQVDWETIAEVSFSEDEIASLRDCPADRRAALFYAIWTRKEAYLKAKGCGFMEPTNHFSVWPEFSFAEAWRIYPLDLAAGFAAAIVADSKLHSIQSFPDGARR